MPTTTPDFDAAFRSRLRELFVWRRDVRHFLADPLPPGALDRLLEIAQYAPSVGLSQPWRFVTVEARERRQAIEAIFRRCNAAALASYTGDSAALYAGLKLAGLAEAPVHLAVYVDPETSVGAGLGRMTMPETAAYSVVSAISILWLAARAEGIGVGWVSILEPDEVSVVLDVPRDWRLIAYLCIGYPAEESTVPELEARGWETRRPVERQIVRR